MTGAKAWDIEAMFRPEYDMVRGQPGSLADYRAAVAENEIHYDWRHGSATVRYRGRLIGLAGERGGIYSVALKIGDEKITKAGIADSETLCALARLYLFVELWVSSVTAGAPVEEAPAAEPPRMGRWLDQVAAERSGR